MRNPWLMRFVPTIVRAQWMYRPYLVIFMLHAEYLVAEQAMIYASAQGLKGPRYWTWVDFIYSLSTKGIFRTYQVLFERFTRGRVKNLTSRIEARLQMGDERVVAHMD